MKKSLLLVFTLLLVVSAFAYNPRYFYNQILLEDGDILDYVTAADPAHDANFVVTVEEIATGNTLSSDVNTIFARVMLLDMGLGEDWAWIFFDTQGLPTPGNLPDGSQFEITLTYLPNPDIATKTIVQTITAPPGSGPVYNVTYPGFGDAAWVLPQSLFGAVGPDEFTLEVTSNYVGAAIYLDEADTGQVTPYTFDPAVAGTYSVMMPNVAWTPEDYVYAADVDATIHFVGTMTPPAATNPVPADGATITWPFGTADQAVTLAWDAVAGVTGYKLAWDEGAHMDLGNVTTWDTPAIGAGQYTWNVVPYITDPAKNGGTRNLAPIGARVNANSPKGDAVGTPTWGFTIAIDGPPVHTLSITSDPTGAAIYVDNADTGEVTPFDFTAAGTYSVMMNDYTWAPEEYVWNGMADDAIEFVGTLIPADYDIDPETPAVLDGGTTVEVTGGGFVGGNIVGAGFTPVPNAAFIPTSEGILQLVGTGLVTLSFTPAAGDTWFVYSIGGGEWIVIDLTDPGTVIPIEIIVDLGAKDEDFEFKSGTGGDPTLPVELSVFNAVLTAQNFVKLSWVSESETNMLGYRVYRAESADQASALLITPIMIEATNTSTTQNYSIEDREVYAGATYYYWLEAVDYAHSSFFGYRAVEVLADITPELPVQSAMRNAYPNPFRANSNTNIEVSVKAGETGTVTIYNVLGQVVKTYSVSEGSHNLSWNGRDSKGNICGSGIYFYKMSTPSMNQTKKMVIVK